MTMSLRFLILAWQGLRSLLINCVLSYGRVLFIYTTLLRLYRQRPHPMPPPCPRIWLPPTPAHRHRALRPRPSRRDARGSR